MDGPIGYSNGGDELIYEWQEIGKGWHRCLGLVTYLHMYTRPNVHMYLRTWKNESFLIYSHDIHRNQTLMINKILQTFATEFAVIFFSKISPDVIIIPTVPFVPTHGPTLGQPNLHIKEMKFAIAIFKTFHLHLHDFRLWNQVCSRSSSSGCGSKKAFARRTSEVRN